MAASSSFVGNGSLSSRSNSGSNRHERPGADTQSITKRCKARIQNRICSTLHDTLWGAGYRYPDGDLVPSRRTSDNSSEDDASANSQEANLVDFLDIAVILVIVGLGFFFYSRARRGRESLEVTQPPPATPLASSTTSHPRRRRLRRPSSLTSALRRLASSGTPR